MTGILIMAIAAATSIACYLSGVRALHVLRGRSLRITLSPPESALDGNYAVVSVPVQVLLLVLFVIGLSVFLLAGPAK